MNWLEKRWYAAAPGMLRMLTPLECAFRYLAARRRRQFAKGLRPSWRAPVPVLVVGNVSVGGTGKTPLVIWLVERLRRRGLRVGVISRGYGGQASRYPLRVRADTPAAESGDEPLLIVRRTGCPLAVAPDRAAAARLLLENEPLDLLISDDGLQHYALERQIEIAVVDAERGLGNGRCLPVGPLREPPARLAEVDLRVANGQVTDHQTLRQLGDYHQMLLAPADLRPVSPEPDASAGEPPKPGDTVHAVAGIGNPQRFFDTLSAQGYRVIAHPFSDHHRFAADELRFADGAPVIMTEKDAVKCAAFGPSDCWYLPVDAQLPVAFEEGLERLLRNYCPHIEGFRSHG